MFLTYAEATFIWYSLPPHDREQLDRFFREQMAAYARWRSMTVSALPCNIRKPPVPNRTPGAV